MTGNPEGYQPNEEELAGSDTTEVAPKQERRGLFRNLFRSKKARGAALAAGVALSSVSGAHTENNPLDAFAAGFEQKSGMKSEVAVHNGARELMGAMLESKNLKDRLIIINGQAFGLADGLGGKSGGEVPAPAAKFAEKYRQFLRLSPEEFNSRKPEFDALVQEMVKTVSNSNDANEIANFLVSIGCRFIMTEGDQFNEGMHGYAVTKGGLGGQDIISEKTFPADTSIENVGQSGLAAVIKTPSATIRKKAKTIIEKNGLQSGAVVILIPKEGDDTVKTMAEASDGFGDELGQVAVAAVTGSEEETKQLNEKLKVAMQ